MRRTWCVGVFAGLVLGGCSGDDTAAAEGPGTGSTTGTSEGEGTTASLSTGAVDETSAGSASSDDEPMPPSALEFARGIRLVRMNHHVGSPSSVRSRGRWSVRTALMWLGSP